MFLFDFNFRNSNIIIFFFCSQEIKNKGTRNKKKKKLQRKLSLRYLFFIHVCKKIICFDSNFQLIISQLMAFIYVIHIYY